MGKTIEQLEKDVMRERNKAINAQSHAYELLMKGKEEVKPDQLKADNYYLNTELRRLIVQRDDLRKEVEQLKRTLNKEA